MRQRRQWKWVLIHLHTFGIAAWIMLCIPAVVYWRTSILFLAFTNIYQIILTHASAHHSLLTDAQKRRRRRNHIKIIAGPQGPMGPPGLPVIR
jgi:hypothetical protein